LNNYRKVVLAASGILLIVLKTAYIFEKNKYRHLQLGSFGGAPSLRKDIGGVQRSA